MLGCRGERTASALENRLADIESRIDQLLASVQASDRKESATLTDTDARSNASGK